VREASGLGRMFGWIYPLADFAGGAAAAVAFLVTQPTAEPEQPGRADQARSDVGLRAV
jgi:hypothetical protein